MKKECSFCVNWTAVDGKSACTFGFDMNAPCLEFVSVLHQRASTHPPIKVSSDVTYNQQEEEMRREFTQEPKIIQDDHYMVSINSKAWAKIYYYTQAAKGEVSGYFKVRRKDEFEFVVTDVIILDQVCNAGHTEISEDTMANWLTALAMKDEDPSNWRGWWHSHCNFDVCWSSEDDRNCENANNEDYMISIVTNKDSQILARLDIFKPVRVTIEPLTRILPTGHARLAKNCTKQVLTKVKEHGQQISQAVGDSEPSEV